MQTFKYLTFRILGMDVETIRRVMSDQEEEIDHKFSTEKIINREYLPEIKAYLTNSNAVVISGPRRSGKSISAILLVKNHNYARLNFDDPSIEGMKAQELVKVNEAIAQLKGNASHIILDEIQSIKGWELYVSRLRETKKVIVTGSNSELMSEEFASRLTGRYISFTTLPFSFAEFIERSGYAAGQYTTKEIANAKALFDSYILLGGFPEAFKQKERYLIQIYNDILTKDIERRFGIKHKETFREFSHYLISNISREVSFNKLKNLFGIKSVHTAKNYMGFLEKAFLIYKIDKYSNKLKQQVSSGKKIYCIDTGISNALGFRANEEKGRLLENVVAIELLRRKHYWNPLSEIYYWQDYSKNEVDFVVKEKEKIKQLIQVCYRLEDYGTKERETKPLLSASKELKCRNLLILTNDYEAEEIVDNKKINFVPVWKWLLTRSKTASEL